MQAHSHFRPIHPVLLSLALACLGTRASGQEPDFDGDVWRDGHGRWVQVVEPARRGQPYVWSRSLDAAAGPAVTVEYLDVTNGTGDGFDDQAMVGAITLGQQRRDTFQAMLTYLFGTVLAGEGGACDIRVEESEVDGTDFLAAAGPTFRALRIARYNPGNASRRIRTGVDINNNQPEAIVTVDFGYVWNSSLNAPGANQYDLYTVLLHELMHTLGFLSLIQPNGTGATGKRIDAYSVFDKYLETSGPPVQRLVTRAIPRYSAAVAELTSTKVRFAGPATNAKWVALGNAGNAPIFSPNPFQNGSSISHWGPGVPGAAVMHPTVAPAVQKRTLHSLDIAVLKDLDYNVVVPAMFTARGNPFVQTTILGVPVLVPAALVPAQ